VKSRPAEKVAHFLGFSSDAHDSLPALRKLSRREWRRVAQWLDDSGLAFYFLQRLKDVGATDTLPIEILSQLERDSAANELRTANLSRRFAVLNKRLDCAGVAFAVVKGFSLTPDFCPSAPLRYQGDFDYLVDAESLLAASRVLIDEGYVPKRCNSSKQSVFVLLAPQPSRQSDKYSAGAPHAVELHTDMWDIGLHGVPMLTDFFSVKRTVTKHWNGLIFPALAGEDAFLLQVIHACHHLFTLWIRTSCFFEVAYFLSRRAGDADFWRRVEERAAGSVVLREFVVIVSELAAQLFAAPLPSLIQTWSADLRPGARVWIEHYARPWAFCELPVYEFSLFPRSKLALFLRQQYEDNSGIDKSEPGTERPPTSRLSRMVAAIRSDPSLAFNRAWWKRQLLIQRGVFHFLSRLRYLFEIPRWRWLNRTRVRTATG